MALPATSTAAIFQMFFCGMYYVKTRERIFDHFVNLHVPFVANDSYISSTLANACFAFTKRKWLCFKLYPTGFNICFSVGISSGNTHKIISTRA